MRDDHALVIQRMHQRVEGAQAIFKGLVVVGHRDSVPAGSMYWAIPGRAVAHTTTLKNEDPGFRVLTAPDSDWLVNAAIRFKRITKQEQSVK